VGYQDAHLGVQSIDLDLGCRFWAEAFEYTNLFKLLQGARDTLGGIHYEIAREALSQLPRAKQILSEVKDKIPGGNDLWFAYRILRHCVGLHSANHTKDFALHFARGPIPTVIDPYDSKSVLDYAEKQEADLWTAIHDIVFPAVRDFRPNFVVLHVRNDGELLQAVLAAKTVRMLEPSTITILDTSDGNEQFDFSSWRDILTREVRFRNYFTHFIPRQDYGLTLRNLVVGGGQIPETRNLVTFASSADQWRAGWRQSIVRDCNERAEIRECFESYRRNTSVFSVGGKTTIATRLSPDRCHWSACSFCTINAQHFLPVESNQNSQLLNDIASFVDLVKTRKIESVILLDEALHPQTLRNFATILIETGLRLTYRARARFTKDFDEEFVKRLYLSGCRYLGCGLESATPRINAMVNKSHDQSLDVKSIVRLLDANGIRPHVYAIMGFPTETKDEVTDTRNLLVDLIRESQHVTSSPNVFHLMKGSVMAAEPERFGIKKLISQGDLRLVLDFQTDEDARPFAHDCAKNVHREQFLPYAEDQGGSAEAFWAFIDQSGIFYSQKTAMSNSPYRFDVLELGDEDACRYAAFVDCIVDGLPMTLAIDWITMNYVLMSVDVWARVANAIFENVPCNEPVCLEAIRALYSKQIIRNTRPETELLSIESKEATSLVS